jgi:hypothetical protein
MLDRSVFGSIEFFGFLGLLLSNTAIIILSEVNSVFYGWLLSAVDWVLWKLSSFYCTFAKYYCVSDLFTLFRSICVYFADVRIFIDNSRQLGIYRCLRLDCTKFIIETVFLMFVHGGLKYCGRRSIFLVLICEVFHPLLVQIKVLGLLVGGRIHLDWLDQNGRIRWFELLMNLMSVSVDTLASHITYKEWLFNTE